MTSLSVTLSLVLLASMGCHLVFVQIKEEKTLRWLNLWYRTVEKTAILTLREGAFTIRGK